MANSLTPVSGTNSNSPAILPDKFSRLKVVPTANVSRIQISLGVASICLKVAILASIYYGGIHDYGPSIMGHGIWAGTIYVIAGSIGIAATYKRIHSILIVTVVMGAVSIVASLVATLFSGLGLVAYNCKDSSYCGNLYGLLVLLFFISIASVISSIVLTSLASVGLGSKPRQNNQQLLYINKENGQLVLVQPQPTLRQVQQAFLQCEFSNMQSQHQPLQLYSPQVQPTLPVDFKQCQ